MKSLILFDLDGTLIDTTPDLGYVLNRLIKETNKPELPLETIRPVISEGVKGLLKLGLNLTPDQKNYEPTRQKYLTLYEKHLADKSTIFPGIEKLLTWIKTQNKQWGIVTNKPAWLTEPLLKKLNIKTDITISGDTLAVTKPDPAPLLHACQQLNTTPNQTIYIGDAPRDIEAGQRANITTIYAGHDVYNETTAQMADHACKTTTELLQTTKEISQ